VQEAEALVLDRWPPNGAEFTMIVQALWWFESCCTLESYEKVMNDICLAGIDRKAILSGVPVDENFRAAQHPCLVHRTLYRRLNHTLRRHAEYGVSRVAPVSEG